MLTVSLYFHNNPTPIATYRAAHVPAPGDHVVLDGQSQGYQVIVRKQHLKHNFSDESAGGWDETWRLIVEPLSEGEEGEGV